MRPHDKHADHLALELAPTYVRTYVRLCVRTHVRTSEEEDEGEDHAPSGGAALVSADGCNARTYRRRCARG